MRTKLLVLLTAASLCAPLALADESVPQDRLVKRYAPLAGSEANAKALVTGLRDGSDIKLTSGSTTTTIDPATGKMGWGNVNHALALAEASLREKGVANPTPEQLKTELSSILSERAGGKGWGEIAHARGFKLGEIARAPKAEGAGRPERVARAERPEKPEKPERPDKPQRPDRPERPGR
jgi:hypothetical protein